MELIQSLIGVLVLIVTFYVAARLDKGAIMYWLAVPMAGGWLLSWFYQREMLNIDGVTIIATICDVAYIVAMMRAAYKASYKPDFSYIVNGEFSSSLELQLVQLDQEVRE